MGFVKGLLVSLTGNRPAQTALGKVADIAQRLMGIGAGSEVGESGEAAIFRHVVPTIGAPMVVFDAGANKGQFLTTARRQLGGVAAVYHCFEPGLTGFAVLQERFGGCDDVVLNNSAVGRQAGCATLWYDRPGSGLASLTKRDLQHFGIGFEHSETVEITTIDDYCAARNISRIDLLKMDIEGHEFDALHGGAGMFECGAVGAVLFEFGGCNIDTRTFFRDFWQFFERHGMRVFRVTPKGYLHPIDRYTESLEQFRTTNYLALANSLGVA